MDIIFATQNKHKVSEINKVLKGMPYDIMTMGAMGFHDDIPETGTTLEENAIIKARYLKNKVDGIIISEDTGLEIRGLNNEPGVNTARFAGPSKNPTSNMNLVLEKLKNVKDRAAQFRAVIALIDGDKEMLFEGIVKGSIGFQKKRRRWLWI